MRMTPAELVAHHEPGLAIEGTRVTVTFGDQGVARAFFDGIFQASDRRRTPDDPTRMIGKRLTTLALQVGQPLEGWADLYLRDGDGQGYHFILDPSDLDNLAEGARSIGPVRAAEARENEALLTRIAHLEQECARLRGPAGRPDLRDMGATLVDKARARLLEAKAELLELESAALRRPTDGGPFQADSFRVSGESDRKVVTATFTDAGRRQVQVELAPDLARELTEGLLSMAQFAAAGGR